MSKRTATRVRKPIGTGSRLQAFHELAPIQIVPLVALKSVQRTDRRPVVKQTSNEVQVLVMKDHEHLVHYSSHTTFAVGGRPHETKKLTWPLKLESPSHWT